ncbi:NUMOD3 domain-containing DNA-binding protein [Paenibacillus chitinolyticus]
MNNKPHSEETKRKISLKLKGRTISDAARLNMSKAHMGHGGRNKGGYTLSDKAKQNIQKGILEKRYTVEYASKLSKAKKGEKNPQSRLTIEKVREIRDLYESGSLSQWKLAQKFEVSRSTIQDIVQYKTWREE